MGEAGLRRRDIDGVSTLRLVSVKDCELTRCLWRWTRFLNVWKGVVALGCEYDFVFPSALTS